jgi:hypothetical protein
LLIYFIQLFSGVLAHNQSRLIHHFLVLNNLSCSKSLVSMQNILHYTHDRVLGSTFDQISGHINHKIHVYHRDHIATCLSNLDCKTVIMNTHELIHIFLALVVNNTILILLCRVVCCMKFILRIFLICPRIFVDFAPNFIFRHTFIEDFLLISLELALNEKIHVWRSVVFWNL